MRGINALIRLHQQHLDVKRVYRTNVEIQRAALEDRVDAIRQDFKQESKVATESLDAGRVFPAYAQRVTQSLKALAAEMSEIDTEIERLNDEIADAFQTLKGYELTRDARLKKLSEEQAHLERTELDEIGATQHRRQAAP